MKKRLAVFWDWIKKERLLEFAAVFFWVITILLLMLSGIGCSTLHTNQVELDPDTGVQRTTDIKIKNFWDSKSELAKMRASTTDKTQGMTIGGYNAETSATNAVTLFQFMMQGAFELGRKSVIPVP